ncbi:MAG TPA: hypothetical protein VH114_00045 [Candidatus Acidoferrum sp.]|jgi:hypothetical protein|nr:hypothetical protein [Candidatus Acidoferrum sp.]
MKLLTALAFILACCALVGGECVEVTGPETKPSSPNAKITVLLDGKPQGSFKLTVTLPKGQGLRSFVTDSHGTAVLKDLPVGADCIAAVGENYLRADLCLAVSVQPERKISSFTLTLVDGLQPAPALGNMQAEEKDAAPERLRRLDLVVLDLSGGAVPHPEIQVYKRGSYPRDAVMKGWTDQEGRFTAPLNPESYAITIRMKGFRSAIRVNEISPEGREGELREVLQLGTC